MQIHRMFGLVIAGATLALGGCAATAPMQAGLSVSDAARGGSSVARGESRERVVEAEGTAEMGDHDTLADVRSRARQDAIRLLFLAGAPLHMEEYRETDFGELVRDSKREESSGVLLERKILKQGLDKKTYRVLMRARYRPADPNDPGIERPERAQSAGDKDKTAHTPDDTAPAEEKPVPIEAAKDPKDRKETGESTPVTGVSRSTDGVTVCFHNFPDVLQRRVLPVLKGIKGITQIDPSNTAYGSLCYRLDYDGRTAELEHRLETDLRTSSTLTFRIERNRGTNMVDLVFDGGFD